MRMAMVVVVVVLLLLLIFLLLLFLLILQTSKFCARLQSDPYHLSAPNQRSSPFEPPKLPLPPPPPLWPFTSRGPARSASACAAAGDAGALGAEAPGESVAERSHRASVASSERAPRARSQCPGGPWATVVFQTMGEVCAGIHPKQQCACSVGWLARSLVVGAPNIHPMDAPRAPDRLGCGPLGRPTYNGQEGIGRTRWGRGRIGFS